MGRVLVVGPAAEPDRSRGGSRLGLGRAARRRARPLPAYRTLTQKVNLSSPGCASALALERAGISPRPVQCVDSCVASTVVTCPVDDSLVAVALARSRGTRTKKAIARRPLAGRRSCFRYQPDPHSPAIRAKGRSPSKFWGGSLGRRGLCAPILPVTGDARARVTSPRLAPSPKRYAPARSEGQSSI